MYRFFALLAFLACVPLANWMIGNVGTTCIPNGPCLIPVGFGLMAPSGVLLVGIAFVLRDIVQETFGRRVAVGAVLVGAAISFTLAPAAVAIASAVAFLVSEIADLWVYSRLREKALPAAVLASGLVGMAIDSALFSLIAFDTLRYQPGHWVGKIYASLAVAALYWWFPRTRPASLATA